MLLDLLFRALPPLLLAAAVWLLYQGVRGLESIAESLRQNR